MNDRNEFAAKTLASVAICVVMSLAFVLIETITSGGASVNSFVISSAQAQEALKDQTPEDDLLGGDDLLDGDDLLSDDDDL